MKGQKLSVWVILTLVAVLFVAPGSVAAKATRIECAGTETLIGYLDPGDWTYPGSNIHVRGMVELYEDVSTCPQLTGMNTVTMNANWDSNFAGPIWGKTIMETLDGGVWETTWHGSTDADGSYSYQVVGRGVAGSVVGLHLRLSATNSEWTATILDPHGG